MIRNKTFKRKKIKARVRGKVSGTATCPRLSVFRSNKQIYAQLIDDLSGRTLVAASSRIEATIKQTEPKLISPSKWDKSLLRKQPKLESPKWFSTVMVTCITDVLNNLPKVQEMED